MALRKYLQLLQPLAGGLSENEVQSFLLEKKDLQFYNSHIDRVLIALGQHADVPCIFTLQDWKFDKEYLLKKIQKLIQHELNLKEPIPVQQLNDGYELMIDDRILKLPAYNLFYRYTYGDDGIPKVPPEIKETFQRVGKFLNGNFYLGFIPYESRFGSELRGVVIVYLSSEQSALLKKLKGLQWESFLSTNHAHNSSGNLKVTTRNGNVLISWREPINFFIYVAVALVLGLLANKLFAWMGWREDFPLHAQKILLLVSIVSGFIGILFIKRSVEFVQRHYVQMTLGLIYIPVLLGRRVYFKDIIRVDVKSRLVSSGDSEGPSTDATYYDISITTSKPTQFRLVKGLGKREANYIATKIRTYTTKS